MKRVQDHVLDELKEHVAKLPPRRNLRPYDIVAELLELYAGARDRGYGLDDFVLVLERHGIKLTRTTVRNYLSRARAAQRIRSGTQPLAIAPPPPREASLPVGKRPAPRQVVSDVAVSGSSASEATYAPRAPMLPTLEPPRAAATSASPPRPAPAGSPSKPVPPAPDALCAAQADQATPAQRPGQWTMTPDLERL